LTTGLRRKNRNPVMRIGKKRVEKKTPIGWNKKVIFVETKMMVKIKRICTNQY
jgi:hypothetical protein